MRRYSVATPCPGPPDYGMGIYPGPIAPNNPPAFLNPVDKYIQDDTTSNLDYTTELKASIRNAKPRRPKAHARKSVFNPADIYVDQQPSPADPWMAQASSISQPLNKNIRRSSVLLARPAQKISVPPPPPPPVPEVPESRHPERAAHTAMRPERRRVSAILEERSERLMERRSSVAGPRRTSVSLAQSQGSTELRKNPRRRTIYIPTEDTTIMTIHPGAPSHNNRSTRAKSPDLGFDLVTLSEEETTDLVPALKQSRAPRKSLAVPPRRGVLQKRSRPSQTVSFASDVPGPVTGKENIPPGAVANKEKESCIVSESTTSLHWPMKWNRLSRQSIADPRPPKYTSETGLTSRKRSLAGTVDSPAKVLKARQNTSPAADFINERARNVKSRGGQPNNSPFRTDCSPPSALRRNRTSRAPSKLKADQRFPMLPDDLGQSELYEDNWLEHQEIALTQLINNMFKTLDCEKDRDTPEKLRQALLKLYHDASVPLLHKKLQASLSYGALALPDDILSGSYRLQDDIGQHQHFLEIWTENYDLDYLKAALEAVVGREITWSLRSSTGSVDSAQSSSRRLKRAITDYISTFIIRNEDTARSTTSVGTIGSIARRYERHGDDVGSKRWSWRRTVLRSLMVILLLDRAKVGGTLRNCLFQNSAPQKSSGAVLTRLGKLILPSFGDIIRPLSHVQYVISHTQYPLEEYTYSITNIATDLRDGVMLSRLVEILLFSPMQLRSQQESEVTITLPAGDILASSISDVKNSWILSQHLKLPCAGHAQKYYNVEIALSAIRGVKGTVSRIVDSISPEDVVNGHRERTLALLWAIVGKWGMKELVDWRAVEKEVQKFRHLGQQAQHTEDQDHCEESRQELGSRGYKSLLQDWAESIAGTHGLKVSNLTTSFADGRVIEAIVDEYLQFCNPPSPGTREDTIFSCPPRTLAEKLCKVGCSRSFVGLFMPSSHHHRIPSKDFTMITLAFLASRLIPLAATHRAASVIQHCWRLSKSRRDLHKRVALMKLAHHCALVVQTRERVVAAATVIQQVWRRSVDRRVKLLSSYTVLFQSIARGWLLRAKLDLRRVAMGKVAEQARGSGFRAGW